MSQYLLLIHSNLQSDTTPAEWEAFFIAARRSEFFKGGSEVGRREIIGNPEPAGPSDHIVGYMRFDADDKEALIDLLKLHPTVLHGGSVELCELPKS